MKDGVRKERRSKCLDKRQGFYMERETTDTQNEYGKNFEFSFQITKRFQLNP